MIFATTIIFSAAATAVMGIMIAAIWAKEKKEEEKE